MKKAIKMIIDADEARSGLSINGNCAMLYKDSDDEIMRKAIDYVEQFSSKFGITVDRERKPILNTDIERDVHIKVDTKIARSMLSCAGFDTDDKTDEEIFTILLDLLKCYGATYNFERKETLENVEF